MLKEWTRRLVEAMTRERVTLTRYVIVGLTSFGVRFVSYAAISRFLWVDGPRSVENIFALAIAMTYNYFLHRYWTFHHQQPAAGTVQRFLIAIIIWNTVDAGLFALLHDVFHVFDLLILFLNTGFIMVMSFLTHRLFTFHANPWKRK